MIQNTFTQCRTIAIDRFRALYIADASNTIFPHLSDVSIDQILPTRPPSIMAKSTLTSPKDAELALRRWVSHAASLGPDTPTFQIRETITELTDLLGRGRLKWNMTYGPDRVDFVRPLPAVEELCRLIAGRAASMSQEEALDLLQALSNLRHRNFVMDDVVLRHDPSFFSESNRSAFVAVSALVLQVCKSPHAFAPQTSTTRSNTPLIDIFTQGASVNESCLTNVTLAAKYVSVLNLSSQRLASLLAATALKHLKAPSTSTSDGYSTTGVKLSVSRLSHVADSFSSLGVPLPELFDVIAQHTPPALDRLRRSMTVEPSRPVDPWPAFVFDLRNAYRVIAATPALCNHSSTYPWLVDTFNVAAAVKVSLFAPIPSDPMSDVIVTGKPISGKTKSPTYLYDSVRLRDATPILLTHRPTAPGGSDKRTQAATFGNTPPSMTWRQHAESGPYPIGECAASLMFSLVTHEVTVSSQAVSHDSRPPFPDLSGLSASVTSFYRLLHNLTPYSFEQAGALKLLKTDVLVSGPSYRACLAAA